MAGFIPASRQLEGVPDYSLAALPGEHRRLYAELFREVGIDETAHVGVLALGVLADNHHVYLARPVALQGRRDSLVQDARTLAHVLVERPAYGQQKSAQRDVILDVGMADRAEEYAVGLAQRIQSVRGHDRPVLHVVVAAPGMFHPVPVNAVLAADGVQHLDPLFYDLYPYPVSPDNGNVVLRH